MGRSKARSSGPLIGIFMISVLALALCGLFGIWHSHRSAMDGMDRLGELARLNDAAREAQVAFKTQVQDWKNLLLRGQDPEAFSDYSAQLDAHHSRVRQSLARLRQAEGLPPTLRQEVESIMTAHANLRNHYNGALAAYSSSDPSSIFRVDQSIRGIDRHLNVRIDRLAEQLAEEGNRTRLALQANGEQLYHGLRLASIIVSLVAVLCAGAIARIALQRRSGTAE